MKRSVAVLIVVAGFLSCAVAVHARPTVVDRIVAVVNDDIITLSELRQYMALLYIGQEQKPSGAEAERAMLNQLIEKKMIAQEGEKLKITVSDAEVNEAVQDILSRNAGLTLEQMRRHIEEAGATMEDYRELLHIEILNSHVVGREVQSRITITDRDVEQYYATQVQPKEKPGARVRIQQILLPVPAGTTTEAANGIRQAAEDLRRKLVAGENFAQMALQYSRGPAARAGGDLGYFHKGELLPAIEAVAFQIEPGHISPVIRTPAGFHLIKVLDRDLTAADRSWKDHEREIKSKIYSREFDRVFASWLENVRKRSYIENNY